MSRDQLAPSLNLGIFRTGRGERETRVTGDEPQGTMGRVQTGPLSPSRLLAKTKMAEVGKNPLPSGYEYEFISTVLDDHHCLICHLPLREPVLTRCGHRFCKNCLDEAIRRYENRTRILSVRLCCKLTFKLGD